MESEELWREDGTRTVDQPSQEDRAAMRPDQPSQENSAATRPDQPSQEDRAATRPVDLPQDSPSNVQTNEAANRNFFVGERFSSYDELKKKLATYEKAKSVQLSHRDSRTLNVARKRVPKRVEAAKQELVYLNITLSCVFGGKKYDNRGSGKRPNQRLALFCSSDRELAFSASS